MTGWRIQVGLALGVAASSGLLWIGSVPFGVPGEWTWDRVTIAAGGATPALLGILVGAIAGAIYIGFGAVGLGRIGKATRTESIMWVSSAACAGFLLLFALQSVSTDDSSQFKSMWVLYDRGASGYFDDSVLATDDTGEFLGNFESKVAQGDVFHIGTHPPGLFLWNRTMLAACRSSPTLTSAVLFTLPESIAESFSELERHAGLLPRKLERPERAALWLGALMTQAIAAATLIPLFLLVNRAHGRRAAWMSSLFWPMVPALAIFLPKSDALFPFAGMLFLWAWHEALRRRSLLFAALAGGVFWFGVLFSLALLPVGLLAVLLTCWETWLRPDDENSPTQKLRRNAILAVCATVTFVAATAGVWLAYDLNMFAVWGWNLKNHAAFYDQAGFPRTYWKWFLANPIELVIATGWPIVFLAVCGARRAFRADVPADGASPPAPRNRFANAGPAACSLTVWLILWLSGRNMGEAARLWLFVMPWFLWAGAAFWDRVPHERASENRSTATRIWIFALSAQLIACLLTVARVNGFHFGV